MQSVVELASFEAAAKMAGITEGEREAIIEHLARNPTAGALIPGTGGARKLRWKGRGHGKSGGYRVITYWAGSRLPVYLLDIYSKGDKADLTATERNELKAVLAPLGVQPRKG